MDKYLLKARLFFNLNRTHGQSMRKSSSSAGEMVNNHSQQHEQAPMNKTDAESLQRREYFSGRVDAGLRD